MIRAEAESLVVRYRKLFRKDKNYYAFNYALEHTIDQKTGKKKYKKNPWFVENQLSVSEYFNHIKSENWNLWGMILPPTNEKNEASFGALDKDIYGDREDNKRIVKQIYDEKIPLVPCSSKSGGLHLYMFFKEDVPASKIRTQLQHYNKYLKINCKEVNPKQTKLKWNKQKKRFDPGNGILIPYMSSLEVKGEEITHDKDCLNKWLKNADLETGNLEEFIDYAESVSVGKDFFGEQPLELEEKTKAEPTLPEEKPKEIKPPIETEERDFSESNARPLSQPLRQILSNIKNKKDHLGGGKFDRWLVDFVFIAMEEKRSDLDIQKHLQKVKDVDKENIYPEGFDEAIQKKINKCRGKYDKVDPAPLREKFMQDVIFNKTSEQYYDNSTKRPYGKVGLETTYAHIFPKSTPPTTYFKEHPKKQLAEEETYRPDLHNEKSPLMKGSDNLYYLNNYKPGKIKPIKPEKVKDIEPFLNLMEHLATIEKERNHVLDILAFIIQKPWKKVKTITVFYTKLQRFGKGSLFDTMVDILGESNAEPTDVKGVLDKGVMFAEKQLVLVDEVKSVGDFGERANFINDLKKIGTETRIQQRKLYVDYKVIKTQTNYLIFTNNPDALNVEAEDERLFIIANENERKPDAWYKVYHKWREDKGSSYVFWYLLNRPISKFNPMAPPPMTEGKKAMRNETGHPLTQKIQEWISEGRYPFSLDESVRGTTELAEYISKHDRGAHVKYANNTKQLRRSLEDAGCVFIGQVKHKLRNEKPTLFLYNNQEELLEKHSPTELCNHIWTPLQSSSREEVVSERSAMNFNNMDNSEFEKQYDTGCWNCRKPIDTESNDKCHECNFGIKCDGEKNGENCGQCICDKPGSKIKKLPEYR